MIINRSTFQLSSDECELLLLFEANQSLHEVAKAMGRDHSVVARALKRIADRFPLVEKKAGKWILTSMGKSVNECTRSAISTQNSALSSHGSLRIGTNREFAHRILAPDLRRIMAIFPNSFITIQSLELGTENALLNGQIDIGIDCERPNDPEIGYQLVLDEPIVAVCSVDFYRMHKKNILEEKLDFLPHLLCDRLNPDRIFLNQESNMTVVAQFNDIAAARAACLSGVGWALLPKYAVKEELESKTMRLMSEKKFGKSKYGIWWPRSRSYLKDSVAKLRKWLEEKEL